MKSLTENQLNFRTIFSNFIDHLGCEREAEKLPLPEQIYLSDLRNPTVPNRWPLDVMVSHVASLHENMILVQIPDIKERFAGVVKLHIETYPKIGKLRDLFLNVSEMLDHIVWLDSRGILTYAIEINDNSLPETEYSRGDGSYTQALMVHCGELHRRAGIQLSSLIELGFSVPNFKDIDVDYNHLLQALNNLEDNLQTLVHLKLHVLFPRTLQLEKRNKERLCQSTLPGKIAGIARVDGRSSLQKNR